MKSISNKIINGFWVGSQLNPLALLTVKSFLDKGHEFVLWAYDEIFNCPQGTRLEDANRIIPKEKVFVYKSGENKGSVSGFSDIFRAKLLYEVGGWYVDMDVSCHRAFDFSDEFVFRAHDIFCTVGNIMKVPRGCELMKQVYEETSEKVTANNVEWILPIKILARQIERYGLVKHIRKDITHDDSWSALKPFLSSNVEVPPSWYAVHWCNEWLKVKNVNLSNLGRDCALIQLFKKYGINYD